MSHTGSESVGLLQVQTFGNMLIKTVSIQGWKLFHFSPPERTGDFKVNIYDLTYVYSKGTE
ncbi:Uncharacterised protein [Cronobacter sakazakii]|nr:Uncharacterised protein [Cronobacter sakazakii]